MTTLYETIRNRRRDTLDRPAIFDSLGSLSFANLFLQAENLGRELEILPGQGIAVHLPNGRDFIITLLAILSRGGVVLPISSTLTADELDQFLDQTGVHAVVTGPDTGGFFSSRGRCSTIGRLTRVDIRLEDSAPLISEVPDAAFVRFTSGTTGDSKGVVLSQASAIERLEAASSVIGFTEDDVIVWVLPMAFHFVVSIVLYLFDGIPVALCSEQSPQGLRATALAHRGTILYASPTTYLMLLSLPANDVISGLRRAFCTTSALSKEVAHRFTQKFGVPITQLFGIFELGLPLSNLRDHTSCPDAVGMPAPGFEAAILSTDGSVLPDEENGHLAIRGPGMFDAYLFPFRSRSAVAVDGWFLTGDIGSRSAKSGAITISGRSNSVIHVAGNKVFPEEVEGVIQVFPGVEKVRVIGKPHTMWGSIVHAEVVGATLTSIDLDALKNFCRERLSGYKVPAQFSIVEEIPTTKSGKVSRRSIPPLAAN